MQTQWMRHGLGLAALLCAIGILLCASPTTAKSATSNCYASAQDAASTDYFFHYHWASERDLPAIKAAMTSKLQALFRCPAKSDSDLADYYLSLALLVPNQAKAFGCANFEPDADSFDIEKLDTWAHQHSREEMLQSIVPRVNKPFACLPRDGQFAYYAGMSVMVAVSANP